MESGSLFHSLIQIQVSLTIQRSASVVALSNEDFCLFNNSGGGYCFRETVLNSIQMLNVRKCVCVCRSLSLSVRWQQIKICLIAAEEGMPGKSKKKGGDFSQQHTA